MYYHRENNWLGHDPSHWTLHLKQSFQWLHKIQNHEFKTQHINDDDDDDVAEKIPIFLAKDAIYKRITGVTQIIYN
jgi:hypothetical protein